MAVRDLTRQKSYRTVLNIRNSGSERAGEDMRIFEDFWLFVPAASPEPLVGQLYVIEKVDEAIFVKIGL